MAETKVSLEALNGLYRKSIGEANAAPFSPNNIDYDTSYRGSKADRVPFKISTVDQYKSIYFWVNPSECSWRIPLRTTIEQVQGGAVHHEWDAIDLNNKSKFDQPTINFSFQAGNIAPYGTTDVSNTIDNFDVGKTQDRTGAVGNLTRKNIPILPAGLGNFYDFLDLLNQPNITKTGAVNYVVIDYVSLMLPSLKLQGFFTSDGVQWSDSADNPQGITSWGASFVVFQSEPALYQGDLLRQMFSNNIHV